MSCKELTTRGSKCQNKVAKDGYCTLHYNKNQDKLRKEKQEIELKNSVAEYIDTELLLTNTYKDIYDVLSSVNINGNLIKLILNYRIDTFADDSWTFLKLNIICITFNSTGKIVQCDCPNCGLWDGDDLVEYSKKNKCRTINHELGHCAHCCCDKCICELSRMNGLAQPIAVADPDECSCWICKLANRIDYF
jgi:hypothetical protein